MPYQLRGRRLVAEETDALSPNTTNQKQEPGVDWLAPVESVQHPLKECLTLIHRQWQEWASPWNQQLTAALQQPRALVVLLGCNRATMMELLQMQQVHAWVMLDPLPGQRLRNVLEQIQSSAVVAIDLLAIQSTFATTQLIRDLLYFVANHDGTEVEGVRGQIAWSAWPTRFLFYSALEPNQRGNQSQEGLNDSNTSDVSPYAIDALVQSMLDDLLTVRERPSWVSKSHCLPSTASMLRAWLSEQGLFLPGPLLFDADALLFLDRALADGSLSLTQLVSLLHYAYSWVRARLEEQPNQRALLDSGTRLYQEWVEVFRPAFLICLRTCQILEIPLSGLALQARLYRGQLSADTVLCRKLGAVITRASVTQLYELARIWDDTALQTWLEHPQLILTEPDTDQHSIARTSSTLPDDVDTTDSQPPTMISSAGLTRGLSTSKRRRQQLQAAFAKAQGRPSALQTIRNRTLQRLLTCPKVLSMKPPPSAVLTLFGVPGVALAEAPTPLLTLSSAPISSLIEENS
jgi:hypothetical protein